MVSVNKISLAVLAVLVTAFLAQPYRIVLVRGRSMTPTLHDGQLLFAGRVNRALERGDIVVLEHNGDTLIKRVARVPGDMFEEAYIPFMHRWIEVNTDSLRDLVRRGVLACRVHRVPKDSVYVLGDNSDVSLDSRMFGMVPISAVRGIVLDS